MSLSELFTLTLFSFSLSDGCYDNSKGHVSTSTSTTTDMLSSSLFGMFTNFNHSTDIQVQLGPTHLPQLFTLSLQPCPSDCQLKDSRVDAIS
ncbi:unnamed protein product, partial [Protopolystoma xenopodis]